MPQVNSSTDSDASTSERGIGFDTSVRDRAVAERREQNEQLRLTTLKQVLTWLETSGEKYGIAHAYLFGSLTRPYRFTERSDVDVAVEIMEPDHFFKAIAALSEYLGRSVDLVELAKCPFADQIRQRGRRWN